MKAILLLLLTVLPVTTAAQQKRQTPARPQPKTHPRRPAPAPTFDTLLPADSYTIYAEVRGAGQFIRSNAVNELLEPVLKLAGPPKEFKSVIKWLNAHADEVMTSRLLVAMWPTNKNLPQSIIAVEFASAEEATKFVTPLNEFLPTVLPTPDTGSLAIRITRQTKTSSAPGTQLSLAATWFTGGADSKAMDHEATEARRQQAALRRCQLPNGAQSIQLRTRLRLHRCQSNRKQEEERRKRNEATQREEEERVKREMAAAAEQKKQAAEPDKPEEAKMRLS